jgi:hypothetical protein
MVAAAEDDRVLGAPGQVQLAAEQEAEVAGPSPCDRRRRAVVDASALLPWMSGNAPPAATDSASFRDR